ncbi:MAG: hypothetical protein H6509_16375 [Bryobacterales bacterium]|nr:hypothetical protein [Bryobacterales bacterium]
MRTRPTAGSPCAECAKYALAAGLFLMIPLRRDAIPDGGAWWGWLDDVGYLIAGVTATHSGLADRRRRDMARAQEKLRRAREAGFKTNGDDPSEGGVWLLGEMNDGRP